MMQLVDDWYFMHSINITTIKLDKKYAFGKYDAHISRIIDPSLKLGHG